MNYQSIFIALISSLAFLSPAFAQDPSIYNRSGVYGGIGGLYAIEDFDNTGTLKFENAPGFNFRLGYRFHPNIAVEAMGERVDAFDLDLPGSGFSGSGKGEINTWTGTLNGKFFALTERFQPYGLLGIGAMQAEGKASGPGGSAEVDETDLAFRYGAGMDSYITENWVFNLEMSYVRPTGDVDDLNYYSLGGGIQYRF